MIECRNITKTYVTGEMETQALRGVSFSVDKGEFVAIIGPSGSGKSTLMHILGCLDVPTTGEYILDGVDVVNEGDDSLAEIRREKIGFVFQSFNLLPRTSVLRNVMLPLVYEGVTERERAPRAEAALRAAAFPEEFWSHKTNQLSGGMMQRVAIARALVSDPAIILADEPTGNLDTVTGNAIMETLERLNQEEGCTVVLITHERDIAAHASRVISVRDGLIVSDVKVEKGEHSSHKDKQHHAHK